MSEDNVLRGLLFLTFLFSLRVLAQLLEYFVDVPFIPDFDKWHSATLPYWLLLLFQCIIIALMLRFCYRVKKGSQSFSRKNGMVLIVMGNLYLLSMLVRHALGVSLLSHTVWFTSFLSIYFHYLLSFFVLGMGYLHIKNGAAP